MADAPRLLVNLDYTEVASPWYRSTYSIPAPYVDFFAADNVAVIGALPAEYGKAVLASMVEMCDGLLLIGGDDYPSDFIGYEKTAHEVPMHLRRARNDFTLFRLAWHSGKPILGICAGMQLATLALGGCLLPHLDGEHAFHRAKSPSEDSMHPVTLAEGRLTSIFGEKEIIVNSSHHQGVCAQTLPDLLFPVAHAPDGLVEAAERKRKGFGLFVQWHPERHPDSTHRDKLLGAFSKAVKHSFTTRGK
jgi:putative glutamine amidotransferase